MINYDKIQTKIEQLKEYTHYLVELSKLPKDELIGDPHKLASSKYHLQVAIECCVDIGNHIIAKSGFPTPKEYKDTFIILGNKGAFSGDFTKTLTQMARFRNRLVHLYWEIDPETIWDILQNKSGDFERFVKDIMDFINKLKEE